LALAGGFASLNPVESPGIGCNLLHPPSSSYFPSSAQRHDSPGDFLHVTLSPSQIAERSLLPERPYLPDDNLQSDYSGTIPAARTGASGSEQVVPLGFFRLTATNQGKT